jgi:hypothetical protein
MFKDLPIHATIPHTINVKDIDGSHLFDSKEAMENLKKCKAYLEKYHRYYPCKQVFDAQWVWEMSFGHYYGTISLNTKK